VVYAVWVTVKLRRDHFGFVLTAEENLGYRALEAEVKNSSNNASLIGEKTQDYKNDDKWLVWMKLGERVGCHQRCDRSFFYKGMQFPVCARCTGVIIAYILALVSYIVTCIRCYVRKCSNPFYSKKSKIIALTGCMTMLIDWTLQALRIKESTNERRLITGFLGGIGLMTLYIRLIRYIKNVLSHRS
jgi:uncharacterized membrane protein